MPERLERDTDPVGLRVPERHTLALRELGDSLRDTQRIAFAVRLAQRDAQRYAERVHLIARTLRDAVHTGRHTE